MSAAADPDVDTSWTDIFSGVTSYLELFTPAQYETISSKLITLSHQTFTVLLACYVNYSAKNPDVLQTDFNKDLMKAAGFLGVLFNSFITIDTIIRSKFKRVRICSEIGLVLGYLSMWCLITVLFGRRSWGILFVTLIVLSVWLSCFLRKFPHGELRGEKADPRLKDVLVRLGRKGDPSGTLHTATLLALIFNPDDAGTDLLVKATKEASPAVVEVVDDSGNVNKSIYYSADKVVVTPGKTKDGGEDEAAKSEDPSKTTIGKHGDESSPADGKVVDDTGTKEEETKGGGEDEAAKSEDPAKTDKSNTSDSESEAVVGDTGIKGEVTKGGGEDEAAKSEDPAKGKVQICERGHTETADSVEVQVPVGI